MSDDTTPAPAPDSAGGNAYPFVWERKTVDGRPQPGEVLAALRKGQHTLPGEVPAMWPFYTRLAADGRVSQELRAEHAALALFGVHQQGQAVSVHWPNVRLGEALHQLRASGRYSEAALDRRVAQCATADDLGEFTTHLRSLITMLKTLPAPQGLDYTLLFRTLVSWQRPERIGRVRRQLGSDYFRFQQHSSTAQTASKKGSSS